MNAQSAARASMVGFGAVALLLAGCAARNWQTAGPRYKCEQGIEFTVKFIDDTAVLESSRGNDVLYRDAGGIGALQSVYSSPQLRAEFGLGSSGREAELRYPMLPLVARCVRD